MDGVSQDDRPRVQNASALPSCMIDGMTEGHPRQPLVEAETGPTLQTQTRLRGAGLYTAEQWEVHKPMIRQLYILENKPYKRVTEILRDEHHFYPTRRQFYRKISEWGFEKNIKDKEMRVLVQSLNRRLNDGEDLRIELRGQEVDPARIQRWRRRHVGTQSVERYFPVDPLHTSLSSMELQNPKQDEPSIALSENSASKHSAGGTQPSQETDVPMREDFSRWSFVDVPGSPLLRRLFEALEIECENLIPSLDLSSDPVENPSSTLETESEVEIKSDCSFREQFESSMGSSSNDLIRYSREILHGSGITSNGANSAITELSFSEWSFREWDFSTGKPLKINRSHIFGLSPFPKVSQTSQYRASDHDYVPAHARFQYWQDQVITCKCKLRNFKRIFGVGDPKVLDVMGALASTYFKQGKDKEAERLYRQIAISCRGTFGMKHILTLRAYLDVIAIIRTRGDFLRANKIHQGVHDIIIRLFDPNEKIHLQSSSTRTSLLYHFDKLDAAEKLIRETFQIQLHTSGLWSKDSSYYMSVLARALNRCGKYDESEHLLRINIHLSREVDGTFSIRGLECKRRLAIVLMNQGKYEEGTSLSRSVAEQIEAKMGQEHVETLYCLYLAAMWLKRRGDLAESAHQLRIVLERQIRIFGEQHRHVYLSMDGLSHVLNNMGRHSEATVLLEKCQKWLAESHGRSYSKVLLNCRRLADNYEKLGCSEDAIVLLQRSIDDARRPGEMPTKDLLETTAKLASLYRKTNRYREAVTSYEQCLSGYAEIYGLSNGWTIYTVEWLGYCYERLRLYGEAFALYQRTFDQLRSTDGDESPALGRLSERMTDVQEILAAGAKVDDADERNEEEDDEDQDMICREGLDKEEPMTNAKSVSVPNSTAGENVTPTEEGWMRQLLDFDALGQSPLNIIEVDEGDRMDET